MKRMHIPVPSPSVKLFKDWEHKIVCHVCNFASPMKLMKSLTWWCWGTCLSMYFYKHSKERSNLGGRFSGALTSHWGTKHTATTRSNKWGRQIANVLQAKVIHAGGQCRCQMPLTSTLPVLCPSETGPPASPELVAPATAQKRDAKRKFRSNHVYCSFCLW